jgi:hypothetical protein
LTDSAFCLLGAPGKTRKVTSASEAALSARLISIALSESHFQYLENVEVLNLLRHENIVVRALVESVVSMNRVAVTPANSSR